MATLRTIMPKTATSLTQSLTTASKVAHMFDWKKSSNHILTLHITKQAIECAIASHPTLSHQTTTKSSWNAMTKTASPSIQTLPSIPLTRDVTLNHTPRNGAIPSFPVASVTKALQDVIQEHNVCGIVVVYPTNTDNGCNNAAFGRVLHVLDHISFTGNHNNNNNTKPICLYDPNTHHHHSEQLLPDEWGRSPLYSTTTTAKVVHCAKQPQSEPGNSTILQQTWYNFVHQYWPNIRTFENEHVDEYGFNDFEEDDDDLSDFTTRLSQNKVHGNVSTFHMNHNNGSIGDNHNKKKLVYQSAF